MKELKELNDRINQYEEGLISAAELNVYLSAASLVLALVVSKEEQDRFA